MKKFKDLQVGDLVYIIYKYPTNINVNKVHCISKDFCLIIDTTSILGTDVRNQSLWILDKEKKLSILDESVFKAFCNEEEFLEDYEKI